LSQSHASHSKRDSAAAGERHSALQAWSPHVMTLLMHALMPEQLSSHASSLQRIVVWPHELSPEQSIRHGQFAGHSMP